jgi:hypothetical protein
MVDKSNTHSNAGQRHEFAEVATTGDVTVGGNLAVTGTQTVTGAVTHTGVVTFNSDPVIGAGKTINLDSATATLVSNAATITKYAVQVTTEALTTAAGAAQAFVLTLTGVAATDLIFVQGAGGTNTREHIVYKAIATTNTVTVTVNNIGPTNAINGTLIFNVWVLKA